MSSDHVFRCLSRSRSAWLDMDGLEELQEKLPALANLSRMLAGWDRSVELLKPTNLSLTCILLCADEFCSESKCVTISLLCCQLFFLPCSYF